AAGALKSLAGHRRRALWKAVGGAADKGLLRKAPLAEDELFLQAPPESEDILRDYRAIGLTLGRHPVALLRTALAQRRFVTAEEFHAFSDRQLARGCGIVTVRQRPGTANGVLFMTIEDETGNINVIIWPSLVDQFRKEVLQARLIGVYGVCQCERNVRHLVAKRLVDLSHLLGTLQISSRDFM
ncbi:MAG: error-prone polymerase, partial [Paucimonas sp.]|nr:error-prone polymerase [Paucimonas sp.]